MYINFKLLKEKGLAPVDVMFLQMIKQQKFENLETHLEIMLKPAPNYVTAAVERGWVSFVKGKAKDSELSKMRIADAGQKLLDDIETPLIEEQDIIVFEWVKKIYLKDNKEVGNQKKAKSNIANFRVHSGISGNCLAALLRDFLKDEEAQAWSMKVEFIFWKPENLYQTKFDLNASRLWHYYEKRKEYFDAKFKQISGNG